MKIIVKQTSLLNSDFEIYYNDVKKYTAKLPAIEIEGIFNLEKKRRMFVYDLNNQIKYESNYSYKENLEGLIPFKYAFTGNQKYNIYSFQSKEEIIDIYCGQTEFLKRTYIIETNGKKYYIFDIQDGSVTHFPIYYENIQIGEILKSGYVPQGKDEYCCYLKDEYQYIADYISLFLLYLDNSEYKSHDYQMEVGYSYSKANKYYDKNWVINNFGDEYYRENNIKISAFNKANDKLMRIIIICFAVLFVITLLIVLILYLITK